MTLGFSILLDLRGVQNLDFHKASTIEDIISGAVTHAGMTMIDLSSHQFSEQQENPSEIGGTTAFALLEESHISVHTWPETGQVVVDIFSCSDLESAERARDYFMNSITHETEKTTIIRRGEF